MHHGTHPSWTMSFLMMDIGMTISHCWNKVIQTSMNVENSIVDIVNQVWGDRDTVDTVACNSINLSAQDETTSSESVLSRDVIQFLDNDDDDVDEIVEEKDDSIAPAIASSKRNLSDKKCDQLKPCFLHESKGVIKKTLENTTQFGKSVLSGPNVRNSIESPFPVCDTFR